MDVLAGHMSTTFLSLAAGSLAHSFGPGFPKAVCTTPTSPIMCIYKVG